VSGEWREVHNVERNILYCSSNIVLVIKSRRKKRAGRVARMGERRGVYRVLVGKPEGKRPHGPRRRWKIILRWTFRKWDVGLWTGLIWLRIAGFAGTCECSNEPSGSIKCGEFLD